jgi:hypothetical protein
MAEFLIRRCSHHLLQLDPARVDQEWLEYSDLSPLAKGWMKASPCLWRASQLFVCRV